MLTKTNTGDINVPLEFVKSYSRILHDLENPMITELTHAACDFLETASSGHCVRLDTFVETFSGWADCLRLSRFPVQTITSITYKDANGDTQTVSASLYETIRIYKRDHIRFLTAFTSPQLYSDSLFPVSVTYQAGYSSSSVPNMAKLAVAQLALNYYEQRSAVNVGSISKPIEFGLESMISALSSPRIIQ